jgi:hypothetical protein
MQPDVIDDPGLASAPKLWRGGIGASAPKMPVR